MKRLLLAASAVFAFLQLVVIWVQLTGAPF